MVKAVDLSHSTSLIPIDSHKLTISFLLLLLQRNTVQFTLELEDVNDNAPVFIQSHFEIYINENESNFPYGFRVEAFDRDLNGKFYFPPLKYTDLVNIVFLKILLGSANSQIRYSIIDGDVQSNFSIDFKTGELSVVHPLDFELLTPSLL